MVYKLLFSLLLILSLITPSIAAAQSNTPPPEIKPEETISKGRVVEITDEGERKVLEQRYPFQKVRVELLDGNEQGKTVPINHGEKTILREEQKVKEGQTVVILKTVTPQVSDYQITDVYRLDRLYPIIALFVIIVLVVSRLRGLGSLLGLGVSLVIIIYFIIPSILSGQDPLLTSIVGSFFIMLITMYLAHGFSSKTHIALFSTCLSLLVTGLLAYVFVNLTFLTGLGSEDASSLRFGETGKINFQGLLLGGIIIGTLGVLDDITTSLTASIQEIAKANPKFGFKELWHGGFRIGTEHIASLVNTLALAYVGAGLPLFLFIVLNPADQPLWMLFNSEMIVEEIIRTLAGSIGLILAMPLTALFAALAFQKKTN